MLMTHEKINQLINDLESLRNSEEGFKKILDRERGILNQLRNVYSNHKDQFDLQLITQINELKNDLVLIEEYLELKEDFKYCKTKEAADDVISSMILIYERLTNPIQLKRIKTDFKKIYHESNYEKLPHDKPLGTRNYRTSLTCPKCLSKMILRSSFYGNFWGCSKFPMCWGKRNKI